MAYVNGATEGTPMAQLGIRALPDSNTHPLVRYPAERLKEIKAQLAEPFDPKEIKWRVTVTSKRHGKNGVEKRGQLIAYANQRAYADRLNAVFGEWGWTRDYDVQVAQNFERPVRTDKTKTTVAAKVVVVCRITVHGLGTQTGVGEEWADDENAATSAEAQAFKRACACFGLGRYLYNLDPVWVDLDEHDRPTRIPTLPNWALPAHAARKEAQPQQAQSSNGMQNSKEALARVNALCETAGYSLARFVLTTYADTPHVEKISPQRMSIVLEKLTDIANGIRRLRKAEALIGTVRYVAITKELNLPSEVFDDIPNREALRQLILRVEAEAGKSSAPSETNESAKATIGETPAGQQSPIVTFGKDSSK